MIVDWSTPLGFAINNQKSTISNRVSAFSLGLSSFAHALVHVRPSLPHALSLLVRNRSKRHMVKPDQRSAVFLAQPVLQIRNDRIRHEQWPRIFDQPRPHPPPRGRAE